MAVHVGNIPHVADEEDLIEFLEEFVGKGTVLSCKILLHQDTARSKGSGFVDFKEKQAATLAVKLSREEKLKFHNRVLKLSINERKLSPRDSSELFPIEYGKLSMGCLTSNEMLYSMWFHEGSLIIEINPEKQNLSLRLKRRDKAWMMEYKMEFCFSEISKLTAVQVNESSGGFLLQVKESPPYLFCRRVVDPTVPTGDAYVDMIESYLGKNLAQKFADEQRAWVRTTDFTPNVIGQSFLYVVETPGYEAEFLNAFLKRTGIFNAAASNLRVKEGKPYSTAQVVVPLLKAVKICIPFKQLFQINNLVQQGKLSGPSLEGRFFKLIKESPFPAVDFALQALAGLENTCYEPVKFLRQQLGLYKRAIQPPSVKLRSFESVRVSVTPACRVLTREHYNGAVDALSRRVNTL